MLTTVTKEAVGARLDAFCAEAAGISRSQAARLIEEGCVLVSGRTEAKKYAVREGDKVVLTLPECREIEALPENIPLDVVYEDDYIIVINKPKGMVVHPAPGNYSGTLVNALLYHCRDSLSGIGGAIRPGIVHRIDKDTSGLLVVAKCDEAHTALSDDLKVHAVEREYRALVTGGFKDDCGTVDLPIGRHPVDRKKMAVVQGGREAVTHYRVLQRFSGFAYVELRLETGRTHQIRVHMASIGHPLLGDTVYGGGHTPFEKRNATTLSGQCLYAKAIGFIHPTTGEKMFFEHELPEWFSEMLTKLENMER